MPSSPQTKSTATGEGTAQANALEEQAHTAPVPSAPSQHMVQLDALRALAVFGVMAFHFTSGHLPSRLHWGDWGVKLFFVLSGFLITGILLGCRDIRENSPRSKPLKQFYIRRALRIFPLFYFVVLATALVNIRPARETLGWNLTYTSNLYFALRGEWDGPVTHIWSLAVEEQFYLLWPFLILYLPRRLVPTCIIGAILLAPLYQIAGYLAGLNGLMLTVTTLGCLNYLGVGALLGLFRYGNRARYDAWARHPRSSWIGLLLLGAMFVAPYAASDSLTRLIASGAAVSLFFGWLIQRASVGFGGPLGALLEWKPLGWVGTISYGIYIYHNFMPVIAPRLWRLVGLNWPQNLWLQVAIAVALTLVIATASWFGLERPINNLKSRFRYQDV